MFPTDSVRHLRGALILSVLAGLVAGCGNNEPAPAASTQSDAPPAAAPADATQPAQPPALLQATTATWAPEAMEELLAPVALYPDPVLVQVLTAATNPQEVLDAGNWLIAHPSLHGDALDEAAQQVADGDVYFSVTIPADFSATLAGLQDDPQAGQIDVVYNDNNSFLASTLGKQAMVQLRDAVAETTTRTAAPGVSRSR